MSPPSPEPSTGTVAQSAGSFSATASMIRPLLRSPASALGAVPSPGIAATAATVSRQVAMTALSKSLHPCGGGTGVGVWFRPLPRPWPGSPASPPGPTWGGTSGDGGLTGVNFCPAAVLSNSAQPESINAPQASMASGAVHFRRYRVRTGQA